MIEPTRIIAIRHGETAWNADTRIQGHIDIPLSDVGRRQAALLGQALADEPVAAIYASDLSRAWDTAGFLGRAVDVAVTPETALRERCFGEFEGKTLPRSKRSCPSNRSAGASAILNSHRPAASRC